MYTRIKNRQLGGFTIIELVLVITIVSVTSAVIVPAFSNVRSGARDTKRLAEVNIIQKALETYYSQNGSYPSTSSWYCSGGSDWQTGELAVALEDYLPTLPTDPINDGTTRTEVLTKDKYGYCYESMINTRLYHLFIRLEDKDVALEERDGAKACGGSWIDTGSFFTSSYHGYIIDYGGSLDC